MHGMQEQRREDTWGGSAGMELFWKKNGIPAKENVDAE
jgi:hypothetical protein